MQRSTWWRATAIAFVLFAACLPFAARMLAGPRGAEVHVRWQPSVDERARAALEDRFHLADGQQLDQYTWRYDLIEPSRDNVRALVIDPAVADTHDIDRPSYSLMPSTARTFRRQRLPGGADAVVATADWLAITLVTLAGVLIVLGVSGRAPTPRAIPALIVRSLQPLASGGLRASGYVTTGFAAVVRFLQHGVPEVDAGTAGMFRIVFGLVLLAFFASRRVDASWLNATFDLEVDGALHAAVLDWLRAHPLVVNLLTPWLLITAAAFTVGIFTRWTYALFVAGVIVWAYVAVSLESTHPLGTFVLALVALLPSRWGDARSVDSWLRRRRGGDSPARPEQRRRVQPPGKQYGYSVWVPGLVFGVGYAAAAWAKLERGPDWVLNGTIKYFFITDSVIAPFDWGLQVANYPRLAIAMSLLAVATEALVVTAAFTRSEIYRLIMGLGGLGLLSGFWVFMGHFWPGWWILLLGFLPWQRLSRPSPTVRLKPDTTYESVRLPPSRAKRASASLAEASGEGGKPDTTYNRARLQVNAAQMAMIALVIGQQVLFSTIKLERAPMFSHYPMYAGTYASPADYDASRPPRYRILASTDRGTVELRCSPHEEFVREFQAALHGASEASANVWRALRGCGENLTSVRYVTLEGEMQVFDWKRLEFTSHAAAVLGPLPASDISTAH